MSSSKPMQNGHLPPGPRAATSTLTPPPRPRNPPAPTHRSALSVSTLPSTSSSLPLRYPPLLYAEADPAPPPHPLGDLTPTSNTTPSPPTPRTPISPIPESSPPSSPSSTASSVMSLPPLSISPRVLESLQRQLVEKSTLLNLANDHISHQSVQIQHLQAKLVWYQQAQASVPTAVGVGGLDGGGGGLGGGAGRGEEVKQLRLLVAHLHGMIAARDEVIGEQDKELCYYQQQMRQLKEAREREVERLGEAESERDRDRERLRVVEAELAKMKERERDRKEREERREQPAPLQAERRAYSDSTEQEMRHLQADAARHRGEERQEEALQPALASVVDAHPASAPPVLPLRTQSEPVTAAAVTGAPAEATSASSPTSPLVSSAVSSPTLAQQTSPLALSPLSSPSPTSSTTQRPLLPKVRRIGPASARASAQLGSQQTNGINANANTSTNSTTAGIQIVPAASTTSIHTAM